MMELKKVMDIGPANITRDETDEEDWENNWKNYFHSFYVDDIRICPTWEEMKEVYPKAVDLGSIF